MFNKELTRFFIIFALITGMTVGFSACARTGKPTGGAGPVSMQQQQQQQEMFGNNMAANEMSERLGNKMEKARNKYKTKHAQNTEKNQMK